ncbi:MAG TPA: 5-methyltetrahydropteroyltriglutamate--homocysteine S-methyltransferase [Gallionella sp.]|nr:5-methyltetrahydropteroyltriglutamate--homocysteine S-methyltransferase [Gallionella sp.]
MNNIHVNGYPRIDKQRQLKFALEKFWRDEITSADLHQVAQAIRLDNWRQQAKAGLQFVTVGDFAYYDQMLNHIALFSCAPARFGFAGKISLGQCFQLARGNAAQPALEMTKWFDTNYHYLVPELSPDTQFSLGSEWLFDEIAEAQAAGFKVKPVLIGPLTFLYLAKEKNTQLNRLDLLEKLLPVYAEVLARLKQQGVEWVQIDEPVLALDIPNAWRMAFERAYFALQNSGLKILLANYFGPFKDNLQTALQLPVAGIHVDCVRGGDEIGVILDWLPSTKVLSCGVIDGRNIWKTDLAKLYRFLKPIAERFGERLWIGSSCSLQHVPISLESEQAMDPEIKNWLAFAQEKLAELALLKAALRCDEPGATRLLESNVAAIASRQASTRVHRTAVAARLAALRDDDARRTSVFTTRQAVQRARFRLPSFTTTTIGSFPQTPEIRAARASFKSGKLGLGEYETAMRAEIAYAVHKQEQIGLDVLVHGEAERNDMVEYFGEQLDGFIFSANGWVQSYGSRCVKPPIIYGDISRPAAMTVNWTVYAQSLTDKPMKGMLTGPVTILQWSFVRDDQPRSTTALQIALAIRDEVHDLEKAGIAIIQIDEPAIREGLPLRKADWADYLAWASRAFRISASCVTDQTQIHTHMCYSEFNDILPAIAAMDADVITIETSRSDMELLRGFGAFKYPNEIGPGVYDIHAPRIPAVAEMVRLLEKAQGVIAPENLWVNPDCGLKTRNWPETEAALINMVEAAKAMRARLTS